MIWEIYNRDIEQWNTKSNICKINERNKLSTLLYKGKGAFFSSSYPFRNERKVFFVASSGMCNLSCSYCVTQRPRNPQSLDIEDFAFIFEHFGENIYFIFSGVGDFFCGYGREDRLLEYVLDHNVKIYLDINGVDIKELAEPNLKGIGKIEMVNISYHFESMRRQKLIRQWKRSIESIQKSNIPYDVKIVISPKEEELAKEAIDFYRKEIQPITNQKLIIVPDGLQDYESQFAKLQSLEESFKECITFWKHKSLYEGGYIGNKKGRFPCAAGSRYFRVLNDGVILPCEFFGDNDMTKLGNVKARKVMSFWRDVSCSYSRLCDCSWASNPRTGLKDQRGNPYIWRSMVKGIEI